MFASQSADGLGRQPASRLFDGLCDSPNQVTAKMILVETRSGYRSDVVLESAHRVDDILLVYIGEHVAPIETLRLEAIAYLHCSPQSSLPGKRHQIAILIGDRK